MGSTVDQFPIFSKKGEPFLLPLQVLGGEKLDFGYIARNKAMSVKFDEKSDGYSGGNLVAKGS